MIVISINISDSSSRTGHQHCTELVVCCATARGVGFALLMGPQGTTRRQSATELLCSVLNRALLGKLVRLAVYLEGNKQDSGLKGRRTQGHHGHGRQVDSSDSGPRTPAASNRMSP